MKKLLIETPVDKLVILAKQKRGITVSEAAKLLGTNDQQIEEWTRILEEKGLLKLAFPVVGPPKIIPVAISQAKFSKKIEEFKERKAEIEILAQSYIEQSKEADKQLNMKFVPVEHELYEKLKNVEGDMKTLGSLKRMEEKLELDIANFEKEKAEISREYEEVEKKTSDVMKDINSVQASTQDLASDIGEALSDMEKREKNVKILADEQKRIEGETEALSKEIKIVSALAGKKPKKSFIDEISGLLQANSKKKKRKKEVPEPAQKGAGA